MPITIRPVNAADEARWRALWAGYLDFYKVQDLAPEITDHTWAMLLGSREDVFGLVAEYNSQVVGIVNCVVHANTWATRPICYLEDLFVDPSARGLGAGRALIEAVFGKARTENWAQVYWRTAEDNATARALYDTLAGKIDFVTYVKRLDDR